MIGTAFAPKIPCPWAPRDCRWEKTEPAFTAPIPACAVDAIELAATPASVNPAAPIPYLVAALTSNAAALLFKPILTASNILLYPALLNLNL